MATFRGRDLVTHFKEAEGNQAVVQYRLEYECLTGTVTHYVDATKPSSTDGDGTRHYRDVLTYAENDAAGLTRTPTLTLYSKNADGRWSAGRDVPAQNPIPVLPAPPVVTPGVDGVQVSLQMPSDGDLEGFVIWVAQDSSVPLTAQNERYRGKATSILVPLPDDATYYLRVAPYDAFGLDQTSAWAALPARRALASEIVQLVPINDLLTELEPLPEQVTQARADIGTERGRVDRAFQDISAANTRIDSIEAGDGGELAAKVEEIRQAQVDDVQALAGYKTTVDGKFTSERGITNGQIQTVQQSQSDANQAFATYKTDVEAKFSSERGVTNSSIQTERTAWTAADKAISDEQTRVKSTYGGNLAELDGRITTVTSAQGSTATLASNLNAQINNAGGLAARVSEASTATTDGRFAQSSALNQLRTEYNGTASTVSRFDGALATVEGKTQAWMTSTVEAGTGRAIVSLRADGQTGSGNIDLAATNIRLLNPANGSYLPALTIENGNATFTGRLRARSIDTEQIAVAGVDLVNMAASSFARIGEDYASGSISVTQPGEYFVPDFEIVLPNVGEFGDLEIQFESGVIQIEQVSGGQQSANDASAFLEVQRHGAATRYSLITDPGNSYLAGTFKKLRLPNTVRGDVVIRVKLVRGSTNTAGYYVNDPDFGSYYVPGERSPNIGAGNISAKAIWRWI